MKGIGPFFFFTFFPFSGIGLVYVQVYFGCYLALWIQVISCCPNARKGCNLGGKSYLLRRYVRIHRVGSWKTLFLPWAKFVGSLWTRLLGVVGIVMKLKERLFVWKDIYVLSVGPFTSEFQTKISSRFTLPETNSSSLKMDGWKTTFLFGFRPIFRRKPLVLREGITAVPHRIIPVLHCNEQMTTMPLGGCPMVVVCGCL